MSGTFFNALQNKNHTVLFKVAGGCALISKHLFKRKPLFLLLSLVISKNIVTTDQVLWPALNNKSALYSLKTSRKNLLVAVILYSALQCLSVCKVM